MAISNVQLGTSATDVCVAGASEERAVLLITLCNTDTTTRTVSLYSYPTGGSATDATVFLKDLAIPSKDTYTWTGNEKMLLAASDKIQGIADVAAKVTVTVSYKALAI